MDNAMDPSMLPNKVDQANALVNISFVFTAISALIVLIRGIIRTGLIKKTGPDNILIFISMLFVIGYLICNVLARDAGLGASILTLTIEQMGTLLKLTYAIELLYYVIIVTTKCSIVAMYYNIALTRSFRVACYTTHALLCVFFIVCISVTFGQCQPLSRQWDPTLAPAARAASCINTTAFFYFTSAFNIVMDFWILAMPLKTLNSLQIRRRDRYVLYGVFGAGIFATAMSCVRLYSIYTYTLSADPFMDGSLINVWSMIEINVGIMCASVPALKPLFTPKLLLARLRGEDPEAPAVRVHSGNISSESSRHYQKSAAKVHHHAAGSEVTLSAPAGDGDHKPPRDSSGIAIRLGSSQKHLVDESIAEEDSDEESVGQRNGRGHRYDDMGGLGRRTTAEDEDDENTIELQRQSQRRG
ncbi:hypothetical protein PG985_009316 [Apiospora marii]|uniref:uncharacterized protein n=1 Tax=Apiospora marii TaxID=335849 RepID=UPI003131DEE2